MFYNRLGDKGLVCAHRGARSLAPENTLLAAKKAFDYKADFWETDVQLSIDGEAVIFHDRTLARTTDADQRKEYAGRRPWNLSEFTARELRSLDAGSWFMHDDPFGTIESGEIHANDYESIKSQRIPLLREALLLSKAHNMPVNLEIKDQTGTPGHETIVAKVLEMLRITKMEDLVLVSSFNHDCLTRLKKLNPTISTAALVEKKHPDNLIDYLKNLGVSAYNPDHSITKPELVQELRQAGFHVNLWTVNDMDRAMMFFNAGASAIITDWPQKLASKLEAE